MSHQLTKFVQDITESFGQWRLWLHLGWNDISTQYRRSFLGPLWITLSTGLFIIAFGMLGSQLFSFDIRTFIPYFATGFIFFTFLSSLITDACDAFQGSAPYLKHSAFPKMVVVLRVIVRNVVMLAHNAIILFGVLFWAKLLDDVLWLYWLFAMALSIFAAIFAVSIVAIISARFRDVPMMVRSIIQITFFMTPVFWRGDQLTERAQWLVLLNPFASFLDLLRSPLLGEPLSSLSLQAAIVIIGLLLVIYIPLFAITRRRLVYWV